MQALSIVSKAKIDEDGDEIERQVEILTKNIDMMNSEKLFDELNKSSVKFGHSQVIPSGNKSKYDKYRILKH